jgi:hypothetical protein
LLDVAHVINFAGVKHQDLNHVLEALSRTVLKGHAQRPLSLDNSILELAGNEGVVEEGTNVWDVRVLRIIEDALLVALQFVEVDLEEVWTLVIEMEDV